MRSSVTTIGCAFQSSYILGGLYINKKSNKVVHFALRLTQEEYDQLVKEYCMFDETMFSSFSAFIRYKLSQTINLKRSLK